MTDIILKYFIQSTIRHQKIHAKKNVQWLTTINKQNIYKLLSIKWVHRNIEFFLFICPLIRISWYRLIYNTLWIHLI